MKTRFFKTVLAAFAILLAVSFAFATERTPEVKTAYYQHPVLGWQSIMIGDECGEFGAEPCLFETFQLYSQASTSSIDLRKN